MNSILHWVAVAFAAAFVITMVVMTGVMVVEAVERMVAVCKGWGGDGE